MKIKKSAFTLAEVLITIGIIGVVSAMGLVISKKSADQAYNSYFYTGYVNLYDAIADAVENDNATMDDDPTTEMPKLVTHISNLFGTSCSKDDDGWYNIKAANGIEYYFTKSYNHSSAQGYIANILMSVPAPKKRNYTDNAYVGLIYMDGSIFKQRQPMLVPINPFFCAHWKKIDGKSITNDRFVDLGARRDLLAAYIDNGTVGRMIPVKEVDSEGSASLSYTSFERIKYYSFNEAFCSINEEFPYSEKVNENTSFVSLAINCNNSAYDDIPKNQVGILRVANPRYIH